MLDLLAEQVHRRYNPLTDSWVLVSPHRNKRPWQGQEESLVIDQRASYDPTCYLCPGNVRSGGKINPSYESVFTFVNDFAALLPEAITSPSITSDLLKAEIERGICKVVCFSPRHDLTIADMELADVHKVVVKWMEEHKELSRIPWIQYIQIFENKGAVMGCSNPHPHGQIWASASLPDEPSKKDKSQALYFQEKGKTLLQDYLDIELSQGERLLFENDSFVVLVPFWAVWPYEAMIVPRRPMSHIVDMTDVEQKDFAKAYKLLAMVYDKLFGVSFPYSAGIHQAPTGGQQPHWHWHMVFMPPLLRSATVKKFMVGYEMLANPQRDITQEQAAKRLRDIYESMEIPKDNLL